MWDISARSIFDQFFVTVSCDTFSLTIDISNVIIMCVEDKKEISFCRRERRVFRI